MALAEALAGHQANFSLIREGWDAERIRLVTCTGREELDETIAQEIRRLTDDGFDRRQIAILSLARSTNPGRIVARRKLGSYALVKADAIAIDAGITADTALRFKGLERDAIILTDLSLHTIETELPEWQTRLYIAAPRAIGRSNCKVDPKI